MACHARLSVHAVELLQQSRLCL